MLVCHVSLRPPRGAITAELVEATTAADATASGHVIFAALVDDPANVRDTVNAYLGEIIREAASASDSVTTVTSVAGTITETATAADTPDATATSPSTWNPSDKAANITLSGGNLTVGASSITAGAVRSTSGKSSGKLYFENTWTNPTGGAGADGVGIGTATAALSGATSLPGNATGGCIVYVGGLIRYNGISTGVNIGAIATGQTHCVAIDLTNSRIWFRINGGNWNNSGTANPATNTGGIDISTLFPSNAPFAVVTKNGSVPSCTTNFGASAFTQTVPSGFTAWG